MLLTLYLNPPIPGLVGPTLPAGWGASAHQKRAGKWWFATVAVAPELARLRHLMRIAGKGQC
jgi:hypothetical protein